VDNLFDRRFPRSLSILSELRRRRLSQRLENVIFGRNSHLPHPGQKLIDCRGPHSLGKTQGIAFDLE
jgi:hypothetical protein